MWEIGEPGNGPTVSIMAGVHGCEYVPMVALRRFLDEVREESPRGCVRIVPLANPRAFYARTPFVGPDDGLNLNRCFPGNASGSYSERLAALLFEKVIRGADYHIDMHAGDLVEDLEPFTLVDVSSVTDASLAMARAYGLGHCVLVERSDSPIAGTSSAAAAEVGIPAITAEVGGRGLVRDEDVEQHLHGLRQSLIHLGVLSGELDAGRTTVEHHGWEWLRSTTTGWWECVVRVGEEVTSCQILGVVHDFENDLHEEIRATGDGVPLFVTSSPAVTQGGLLMGVARR